MSTETIYNVKRKKFGISEQIIVYSKAVVGGVQSPNKGKTIEQIVRKAKTISEYKYRNLKCIKDSSRRSKKMIYDVTRSNIWEWFVTITFNPELVDSMDYEECVKKLSKWINNIRTRNCTGMVYIFVPELHKSGRYHFHGLISHCEGLQFENSGHFDKGGNIIYNIGKYKLGFTTATKVRNSEAAEKYIAKYVTKELTSHLKGKRRYWKSKNCKVPDLEYYFNKRDTHMDLHDSLISRSDYLFAQEKEYTDKQGKSQYVRYYEFKGGNDDQRDDIKAHE